MLVRSDEPLARTEFISPRASGRALVSSPDIIYLAVVNNVSYTTHCCFPVVLYSEFCAALSHFTHSLIATEALSEALQVTVITRCRYH